MDWTKLNPFRAKLNPAQPELGGNIQPSTAPLGSYQKAYEKLEIVNRGVNMIVDDTSKIPVRVGDQCSQKAKVTSGIKKIQVERLMNTEPNEFQDINTFKRNCFVDYLLDGNIFIYFDGNYLYHLPANKVYIHTSRVTFVKKYTYNEIIDYHPNEIIHIKENSFKSIYRGMSRLKPALRTMQLMLDMRDFQDNFFKNGAVPGLVLKSPNTLSDKIKARLINSWAQTYNPRTGGKRPLVLDGGLEIDSITNVNFKELDFQTSISDNENIILKALGIPPIMMDSGNNANIRPNTRMYYLQTILPIVQKWNIAFERYFGFQITEDVTDIQALQPELSDQSNYYTSLVNTGVITANEARDRLGFEKDTDPESDKLRIPANIAGSAANPSDGGKPANTEGEDK
jgi:HK97 family phage portal protein